MSKKTLRVIIITLSTLLALFVLAGWFASRQTPAPLPPAPTPEIIQPTPDPTPEIIEVTGIRLLVENNVMPVYTRFWPEVIIQPHNATDKYYELISDDERVVRRHGNSWMATAVGTANLTATAPNGISVTVTITVTPPELEALAFAHEEVTLHLDDFLDVVLIRTPGNAVEEDQIKFISDNERVATISNEGRITAVGAGSTTITASYRDIQAKMRVNVIVPITGIRVDIDRLVFRVGEQTSFRYQVEPESASNTSVTVSFSGAQVTHSIVANTLTFDSAGEVKISLSVGNTVLTEVTIIVHDLAVLADEVFRLTNLERTNRGLPALGRVQNLTDVAQLRAGEIIIRLEQDHRRPDGRDWFTILEDYHIECIYARENLARGQTSPAEVVQAWMNSTGHRESILHPDVNHLGVGIVMDNAGSLYWVQLFIEQ